MLKNKYAKILISRTKSIIKKTILWACLLYIFYVFNNPQNDYISKKVSEVIVKCCMFVVIGLFILSGVYITLALLLGNENDVEKICLFIIENHISLMFAILLQ